MENQTQQQNAGGVTIAPQKKSTSPVQKVLFWIEVAIIVVRRYFDLQLYTLTDGTHLNDRSSLAFYAVSEENMTVVLIIVSVFLCVYSIRSISRSRREKTKPKSIVYAGLVISLWVLIASIVLIVALLFWHD